MIIAFSGHRNKSIDEHILVNVYTSYPGATWLHGGAIGFDSQVHNFAVALDIPTIVIKPDYRKYKKAAPLIRNEEIVKRCDILIALYDGRGSGGTFYTIQYARKMGKQVFIHVPNTNI